LAAVAIPKLAATRDDAVDARVRSNVATCLSDVVSAYTAQGTAPATGASDACSKGNKDNTAMDVSVSGDVVTVKGKLSDGTSTFALSAQYKGSHVSI
jgi:type II secretory pathway pseudopilin PulG